MRPLPDTNIPDAIHHRTRIRIHDHSAHAPGRYGILLGQPRNNPQWLTIGLTDDHGTYTGERTLIDRAYVRLVNAYPLTHQQVQDGLEAAVAEHGPHHTYSRPLDSDYALNIHQHPDGTLTCGCLIATGLHHAGVPLEALAQHPKATATDLSTSLITVPHHTTIAMQAAQDLQDLEEPWGAALDLFRTTAAAQARAHGLN